MVSVSLMPRKGNHTKFFPHSGHLGLTPVAVAGTLKLERAEDESQVEIAEALVRLRCYEAVGGQAQINEHAVSEDFSSENMNVLWETASIVWAPSSPPSAPAHNQPTDFETDWTLIVPRAATDYSQKGFAVGSMTYKNWKSWWQIEAVVRLVHSKNKTITKCYPLHLKNFHPLSSLGTLTHVQGTAPDPLITYSLSHPAQVSCGDVATVNVSLRTDHSDEKDRPLKFKKVIITLERSLLVDGDSSDQTKLANPSDPASETSSSAVLVAESFPKPKERTKLRYTQSLGKLRSRPRSPLRPPVVRKPVVTVIQAAEIPMAKIDRDDRTAPASSLAWVGRVDLVVPRPKSAYHYSIGDTCKTKFVSVAYHLKAQVVIKTKRGNTQVVNLGGSEVELSSVPTLDRESACRNYKKLVSHFGKCQETASVPAVDSKARRQFGPKCFAPCAMTV